MSQMPFGAAVIGTEHAHATGNLRSIQLSKHFELVAVAEPNEALRRIAESNPRWADVPWTDVDAIFSDDRIQMVCVETDPLESLPYAERAVEAGKHVRIDKPPGADYRRLAKIYDEAQRRHLIIQVAYIFRYQPAFELAYRAIRENWFGSVRAAVCQMNDLPGPKDRKKVDRFPGGQMFEICCHMVDALIWLLGKVTRVTPILRHSDPVDDQLEDDVMAIFEFEPAVAVVKSCTRNRIRYFEILGDAGGIRIGVSGRPQTVQLTLSKPHGNFKTGVQNVPVDSADGFLPDLEELAAAIREHRPLQYFDPEHDLTVHRALLTASGLDV